ncbi:MAG: DJ-1/PfpI family protein [Gammaproteobacteria bacterium]
MTPLRVSILVFPDVEVLDFAGPFEVFSVARLDESRRRERPSPFDTRLVAAKPGPVKAVGGLQVVADHGLEDGPPPEVLVVPGGTGARAAMEDGRLVSWISRTAASARVVASVCTGALLLGRAGLLEGRRATTHWTALDDMAELFPGVRVVKNCRVVDEGAVVTSAGIAAGIDMALTLVARFHGAGVAESAARYMEYPCPAHLRQRGEPD